MVADAEGGNREAPAPLEELQRYDLESSPSGYSTITLSLPTKAAILMVQARTMGQVTYLLRNVRDTKVEKDRSGVTVAPGQSFGDTVRSYQ